MRVLVCGSRTIANPKLKDRDTVRSELNYVANVLQQGYGTYDCIIQGEAPGADLTAKAWAWRNGVPTADFPADWKRFGKSAGPRRNALMLSEGKPDLVLAFIDKPLHESRGTRDMVAKAADAGVTVHIFDVTQRSQVQ